MKNKLTVTIGIPAYNEEKNIGHLLESLLKQKEKTFEIKKIIVVSDGSTDSTLSVVKSFKDPRIRYVNGEERKGKSTRLNQLFSTLTTDVLVIIDADMVCKDTYTLERLVDGFLQKKRVGLVSGKPEPLPGKTLIQTALNNYFHACESVEDEFDMGTTAYSTHGFLAYSKNFVQNFSIPSDIVNDDAFSYFTCITSHFSHAYAKNAITYLQSPATIKDYINQMNRYIRGGIQLHEYFDKDLVERGIVLPKRIHLRIMLYQLRKNPLAYIMLKTITLSVIFYNKLFPKTQYQWHYIKTSKSMY